MKIAVSACLLGEKIRYDGKDKYNPLLVHELEQVAELVPFCPEHLAFGTPRATIRLVKKSERIHAYSNDNLDLTQLLREQCDHEISRLEAQSICGIVLKSKSPSCGLNSAKLYQTDGLYLGEEDGIFTSMIRQKYPFLPIEEDERLNDPFIRANFIQKITAYYGAK